jgi:hypothetical protein
MAGIYTPESTPDDMSALNTHIKSNVVNALNEVFSYVQKAEKMVHVDIALAGPVAISALPSNAKIVGWQVHVGVAYPAGATITIGDHSGSLGALAATSIVTAAGTATALGDYQGPLYYLPVGDLSISIAGGNGSTGAATVFIKYIDA